MVVKVTRKAFANNCDGCAVSQRTKRPIFSSSIITLPGDWVINQYGGGEGYLGWLALQPRFHRKSLSELSGDELRELGPNIVLIQRLLNRYWKSSFRKDPLLRLYVVYFFESPFDRPASLFHLHIHLIPRTKDLGKLLRVFPDRRVTAQSAQEINAWKVPELTTSGSFPKRYRRTKRNVHALIQWLRKRLP